MSTPTSSKGFFFVDRPPLARLPPTGSQKGTGLELLPQTIGPFSITALKQHTLTINEDRIPNTIFNDGVNRVPNLADLHPQASDSRQRENNTAKGRNNPTVQSTNAHQPGNSPNIQSSTKSKPQPKPIPNPQEYVAGRIEPHNEKPPNIKYIFCWYVYGASNDTVEPSKNPPNKFVERSSRTVAKRSN